ncbi:MAG: M10 family metallopeptidase C-terminal domain-containing protein [Bacteroidota bacterium]
MYGAGFQAPEAAAFSVAYLLPDGELPAANGLVEGRFIQTEFNQSFEVVGYSFARDTRYDFSALRLVDMVDGSYTSSPYGDAELVIAGMQSARIISSSGSDVVFGSSFSDTIATGLGDDRVFGGGGSDLLDGGAGWDTADYWLSMLSLTADLQMSQFNTGDAHGDVFRSIENLQGTRFDDDLRGDAQANQIWGGTGNDTLSGRHGTDTLIGGDGADVFIFDASADPDTILDFELGKDRIDITEWKSTTYKNIELISQHEGGKYSLTVKSTQDDYSIIFLNLHSDPLLHLSADDFIFG